MNNIFSAQRNSAIFLATLLVLGTISAILPSAQAQPYYEEEYYQEYPSYQDNNYYKSKDSSSFINKIKCNNINDNLNNVDVNLGLPFGNDALSEDEGQATTAANGWGYGNEYKQKDNGFKFVCINNNDNENNVVVVNETTPEPPTPEPPIPNPTKITVTKEMFICSDPVVTPFGSNPEFDFFTFDCYDNTGTIPDPDSSTWIPWEDCNIDTFCPFVSEEDFTMQIEHNSGPVFSRYEFPGSSQGQSVNVESGTYQITEEGNVPDLRTCQNPSYEGLVNIQNASPTHISQAIFCFILEDDCSGTIEPGEEKACTIKNYLDNAFFGVPTEGLTASNIDTDISALNSNTSGLSSHFSSPPTISQGTEDLTALEKTTKLKKQWLDLLP